MVLSRPRGFRVSLENYQALYREKVLKAIRNTVKGNYDPVDEVDTYLLAGPNVESMMGEKPSPELLWDALQELDGWSGPMWAMARYLRKKGGFGRGEGRPVGELPREPVSGELEDGAPDP